MLLTLAALGGWEALGGRFCSQGTPQKHRAWGLNTRPLGQVCVTCLSSMKTLKLDKLKYVLKIETQYVTTMKY